MVKEKSDFRNLIEHFRHYFSGSIAVKALGVVSLPVMTRLLSQSEYGTLSVYNAYLGIFVIVLSLNTYSAVGRYSYEASDDFNTFLGTTLLFVFSCFMAFGLLIILFQQSFSSIIKLPPQLVPYLVLGALFSTITNIYYQVLIARRESKIFSTLNIVNGYSTFILSLVLVLLLKEQRYLGNIWGGLGISFLLAIYAGRHLVKEAFFSFNRQHMKYIASYAIPLLPYSLGGIILEQVDRIMIGEMIDKSSVGIYSIGYSVGMLITIVTGALHTAIIPDFYRFVGDAEHHRLHQLWERAFKVISLASAGLILFSHEMVTILADRKFHHATNVVTPVIFGYIFFQMYYVYSLYIDHAKKSIYATSILLFAGAVNIGLNYLLLPSFGYMAAAFTTMFSYLLMVFIAWYIAKHVLRFVVTPLWVIVKPVGLLVLCTLPALYPSFAASMPTLISLGIRCAAMVLLGAILFGNQLRTILQGRGAAA